MDIICAGINHQTWYISVTHKGEDLTGKLLEAFEQHPEFSKTEKVRIDMLRRFGYYSTESNGHLSEYVPWYRKRPEEINKWIDRTSPPGSTGRPAATCACAPRAATGSRTTSRNWLAEPPAPFGPEHAATSTAPTSSKAWRRAGSTAGTSTWSTAAASPTCPGDCIVEVPGYVDGNGINIPVVGDLPLGCAAVCNASISVQRLAVEAAVHGDDVLLRQAMMMDPLTGAVCNPPEIWQMVDEMLVAQEQWLPQYAKAIADAKERLAHGKLIPTKEGYAGAGAAAHQDGGGDAGGEGVGAAGSLTGSRSPAPPGRSWKCAAPTGHVRRHSRDYPRAGGGNGPGRVPGLRGRSSPGRSRRA